jgi:hypothetical protein
MRARLGVILLLSCEAPPESAHDCSQRCNHCEPGCVVDRGMSRHDEACDVDCGVDNDMWVCDVEVGECTVMWF